MYRDAEQQSMVEFQRAKEHKDDACLAATGARPGDQ